MITQPVLEVLSLEEEAIDDEFLAEFQAGMSKEQILSFLSDSAPDSFPQSPAGNIEDNTEAFCKAEIRLMFLPRVTRPARDRFISLQQWEGVVCSIGADSFVAKLIDLTGGGAGEGQVSTAVRKQSKIGGEEVVRPGRTEIGQLFSSDFLPDQVPFTSLLFVFLL